VQVESKTLERLLEALDLRHLSGWYHPAMRLQAQLQSLEGSNTVLREQLRTTRYIHFYTYWFQEVSASIIRVTRIGELGTSAVTGNQRTQHVSVASYG
jgi:hypothetical protein